MAWLTSTFGSISVTHRFQITEYGVQKTEGYFYRVWKKLVVIHKTI